MPIEATHKIWMDGEYVDWDKATIHVLTPSLHYGWGVFEGIRAYDTPRGPAVFRLTDHMKRLYRSAKIYHMEPPISLEGAIKVTKDLVAMNEVRECYIRPLVYLGYGEIGLNPLTSGIRMAIACWPWGAYLGEEAFETGVRVKISSWRRLDPNIIPPAAKATGQYLNSSLAKAEAINAGYDEGVLLNANGFVTDNLFGDILTDLGAAIAGGLGTAASANLNPGGAEGSGGPRAAGPSLFEPVHGSAPDIAGSGRANPVAAVLSAGLMLDHLGEREAAAALEEAVMAVLPSAARYSTREIGEQVAVAVALQASA